VNVDVPKSQIVITEKDESQKSLILEIQKLCESVQSAVSHRAPAPVVKVENNIPDIKMPEIRMPDIHMPDFRMPEIRMPEIKIPNIIMPEMKAPDVIVQRPAPRTWRFEHKYDKYNKMVQTIAVPDK
jgi:hypothetical protein